MRNLCRDCCEVTTGDCGRHGPLMTPALLDLVEADQVLRMLDAVTAAIAAGRKSGLLEAAQLVCSLCARDVPHHTNAAGSIGGADRHVIRDLHAVEDTSGVGLAECLAFKVWERIDEIGGER